METLKLLLFLWCAHYGILADHSHIIPVENYKSELQELGQHVEIPETPVKVIKITKTVAVRIPVPYPVKVIEKVPYPVHISKPYPVPVPQIVHVPHPSHKSNGHEALDVSQNSDLQHDGKQSNETPVYESHDESSYGSPYPGKQSLDGDFGHFDHIGHNHHGEQTSYDNNYFPSHDGDNGHYESRNYRTIKRFPPAKQTKTDY